MLAANIGAGSTVGATGLGYRDGLAAVWWVGSAAVGSLVLALWIGPAIRRVAAEHDLRTVGDFLEFRYGVAVRTAIAALLWVGSLFILAGQLIAIASILNVIVGVPPAVGCAIGGLLITIYFTAGGLLTSAWVNVVQLTVKLVGFAIALPLALSAAGRMACGRARCSPTPDYWNPWQGGPLRADLSRDARAGLRRLARAAAEDLRRARRPRGAPRRRRERARAGRSTRWSRSCMGMIARAAVPRPRGAASSRCRRS